MPSSDEYWRNPEKHRAKTRKYHAAHPEEKRKAGREWAAKKRLTDPDFVAREKAAQKKYRENNREKRGAAVKAWFEKNPTYNRDWHARKRNKRPEYYLWHGARVRAKRKGLLFSLEISDMAIPEHCPVLGIKIEVGGGGFSPSSPSLDRLIPSLGYTKENVRIISMRANKIKSDATIDELLLVAGYMSREIKKLKGPP